jgi:ATP-dependent Clp protease ATP-binding subunit ClpB
MLKKQQIDIQVTEQAVQALADQGYDPHYGARPVKRVIQKTVINELSRDILAGKINRDKPVWVDYDGGQMVFSNQTYPASTE